MALLSNQIITKEALAIISETSSLLPNITLDSAENLGTSGTNYIGIRKAVQINGRIDSNTFSAETLNEESANLALSRIFGADFSFSDSEMALTVQDFSYRYIKPAIKKIISNCEVAMFKDFLAGAGSTVFGTKATALDDLFQTSTQLELRSAGDERVFIGSPQLMEGIFKQGRGLFNDQSELAKQYKAGMAGTIGGQDVFSSARVPAYSLGAFVDGSVAVGMTEGSATITIAGLTAGGIKKGQAFTIAGCFELNPDTKDSLGTLFTFRASADSTAGVVVVQQKMFASGTDARRNCSAIISATVAVDILGSGSTIYQALSFDKSALIAKCVILDIPKGLDKGEVMTEDGLSVRFARDWDINTATWKCRLDIQVGWVVGTPTGVCGLVAS
jgi:hypothetical protein